MTAWQKCFEALFSRAFAKSPSPALAELAPKKVWNSTFSLCLLQRHYAVACRVTGGGLLWLKNLLALQPLRINRSSKKKKKTTTKKISCQPYRAYSLAHVKATLRHIVHAFTGNIRGMYTCQIPFMYIYMVTCTK